MLVIAKGFYILLIQILTECLSIFQDILISELMALLHKHNIKSMHCGKLNSEGQRFIRI